VEWDDQEQSWMLALNLHRNLTCSGCGGWLPETTSPAADGSYVVDPPVRCHGCDALGAVQEAHAKQHKRMQATRWYSPRRRFVRRG